MRKLTHEEFLNKFYEKNKHANDIEILGTYINSRTKIKCRCKKCGHEWESTPANLLKGHGCHKCAITNKLSHEEFIKRLQQISPDIEVLKTYKDYKTKILCKCKIDGYEWHALPSNLLKGHGCPQCAGNAKVTYKKFIQRLKQINTNIEIKGTYINMTTKILCKCKIDGYEWEVIPYSLLQGFGCPKCGGTIKRTHEEFLNRLQQVNPNIEVLGTYINAETKILCKCKIDGHIWEVRPYSLLLGYGCPKCGGNAKLTHEEFIEKLQQVNSNIDVQGTYINSVTKIECKCKICGHEWTVIPASLLQGRGCPKCNTSRGEKRIAQYLDNLGMDYIYNKRYFNDLVGAGGGLLRPDFIIPSLKIWIEYDGIQHYEPTDFTGKMSKKEIQQRFDYTQQNDLIKNQYAKDNNWTLIRIPFTEYDNIEQILAEYIEQEEQVI